MSMKDIFEANTDKVDLAVELLGELGDRTGKYVWKKYEVVKGETVENPSITLTMSESGTSATITNSNFDLTKVDLDKLTSADSFFNNFNSSEGYKIYYDEATSLFRLYVSSVRVKNITAFTPTSATTGTFTLNGAIDWDATADFTYEGTKQLTEDVHTFLTYVTADDETAYPDKALDADGYWYERVSEGAKQGILFNKVDAEGYPLDIDFIMEDAPASVNGVMKSAVGWIARCKTVQIFVKTIVDRGFEDVFTNFGGKLKLKTVEHMNILAFQHFGTSGTSAPKIWIPNSCVRISATSYTSSPFYIANANAKIYCEAPSKPSDWGNYWNYRATNSTLTTTWGVTEEQFDAL